MTVLAPSRAFNCPTARWCSWRSVISGELSTWMAGSIRRSPCTRGTFPHIGHYEGDTLVIETRHIIGWASEREQRWLDRLGHPFSDELRIVERIRRVDEDTLENEITIYDPIACDRAFSGTLTFRRRDFELAEFICQELMLSELPE